MNPAMDGSIVRVQLHEAKDLPIADFAIGGGKSDPYVIFQLQQHQPPTPPPKTTTSPSATSFTSTVVKNDLNPQWYRERHDFRLPPQDIAHTMLHITVMDFDQTSRDDLMATAAIPLGTLFPPPPPPPTVATSQPKVSTTTSIPMQAFPLQVASAFQKQQVHPVIVLSIVILTPYEATAELQFEVYENERWSIRKGWSKDHLLANERKNWSTSDGQKSSGAFQEIAPQVPPQYESKNGWSYVGILGDHEGWQYAVSFLGPWHTRKTIVSMVRRRKWENTCQRIESK